MAQHKIKAQLYDNVLTENPNDFIARVVSEKSLDIKDIAQSAVQRGGADISAAAMEHAVQLWLKEMAYSLCDGFSVNTGWFMAMPKIRGIFDSPNEKFNAEKHAITFDMRQGLLLRNELSDIEVDITGIADTSAIITQVKDVKTGSINDLITPNRNLRISGSKIRIAGESEQNGVFFINDQSGERVKIDLSDIVNNNPSELVIVTPDLAAGMYKLEVVTQYIGNNKNFLKEPRVATFDKILTVVTAV